MMKNANLGTRNLRSTAMLNVTVLVIDPESVQVRLAVYVAAPAAMVGVPLMTPLVETERPVLVDKSGMSIVYAVHPVTLGVIEDARGLL